MADGPDAVERLCSLGDPTRRRLYEFAVAQGTSVTRDEASDALSLDRSVVAYHLDKLVEQGLLAASFARPEGRGGPGAGRPAKHYQRAEGELAVSVPPRDYRLVAELLARAAEADDTGTIRHALSVAAFKFGRELAGDGDQPPRERRELLERLGFEPYDDGGVIRLRNCPFQRLSREHTELVCGMNLALIRGLVEATGPDVRAELHPAPGRCCVALTP